MAPNSSHASGVPGIPGIWPAWRCKARRRAAASSSTSKLCVFRLPRSLLDSSPSPLSPVGYAGEAGVTFLAELDSVDIV